MKSFRFGLTVDLFRSKQEESKVLIVNRDYQNEINIISWLKPILPTTSDNYGPRLN